MSTLASQTKEEPAKVDADRLVIVVQIDAKGRKFVAETWAGLSNWQIATALASRAYADLTVHSIVEMIAGETCGRNIASEIANELESIAVQAIDERWSGFADCAARLMADHHVADAWEARVDAHFKDGLDLGDYIAIHKALFAKGYTKSQIEKHSDDASYLARRAVQCEQTVDNVACIALMPVMGALAVLAWIIAPEPAHAAILTPAALQDGIDGWLIGITTGIGFFCGWLFGLVQFGPRRSRIRPGIDHAEADGP